MWSRIASGCPDWFTDSGERSDMNPSHDEWVRQSIAEHGPSGAFGLLIAESDAQLSGPDLDHGLEFAAARTAITPQIERTKVVGLVALPGAMTGLLLAGVDPVDAVVVQLLVMLLVLGTVVVSVATVVGAIMHSAITPRLNLAEWARVPASSE